MASIFTGILLTAMLFPAFVGKSLAGDMDHHMMHTPAGEKASQADGRQKISADHAIHVGKLLRQVEIKGYNITYHLVDMSSQVKDMESGGMTDKRGQEHAIAYATVLTLKGEKARARSRYHLMFYLTDSHGNSIKCDHLELQHISSEGEPEKMQPMTMERGWGVDLDLTTEGLHTIKVRFEKDGKVIADEFTYEAS